MLVRSSALRASNRPQYIHVTLEDRPAGQRKHVLRVPSLSSCLVLAPSMARASSAAKRLQEDTVSPEVLQAGVVTLDTAAAVVGATWWHTQIALETSWKSAEVQGMDLGTYGDLTWEDLSWGIPTDGVSPGDHATAVAEYSEAREAVALARNPKGPDGDPSPVNTSGLAMAVARANKLGKAFRWAPYTATDLSLLYGAVAMGIVSMLPRRKAVEDAVDFTGDQEET